MYPRRFAALTVISIIASTGMLSADNLATRPQPAKALVMAIAAHPDDEPAGLLACYGAGLGLPVVWVQMTSGDMWWFDPKNPAHPKWGKMRERECLNAARGYGLSHPPVFGRFRCASWPDPKKEYFARWGGQEPALRFIVGLIRKHRPEVVWSHATNGDYGHNDHVACSLVAREAVVAAADPARFTDLPAPNRPWQVKKLYLNTGNYGAWYDMHATLPGLGGRTTSQAATAGYRCHVSQGTTNASLVAGCRVALWSSTVGPDHDDNILDNLDLSAWAPRTIHGTVTLPAGEIAPAGGTRLSLVTVTTSGYWYRQPLVIPAGQTRAWFHLLRTMETGKTYKIGLSRTEPGRQWQLFWHPEGMRPEKDAAWVTLKPEGTRIGLVVAR